MEAAYASVRASPTISRHFSHGEAIPRERTAGHCRNTFHGSYLVKPLLASDQILLCQHLGASHMPLWLVSSCICDSSALLKAPPQPTAESRQLTLWCVTMAPFDSEPGKTLPRALELDMEILRLCCEDFFPGF